MQSANDADPYFFASPEIASYGPSTVPPQLFSDPPIETFDLSWLSPPATNLDLLYDTPFANSFLPVHLFETSWFADSATSKIPPLNDFQHRDSFHSQPIPLPSASVSETRSSVTHVTPKRRVQKGRRQSEEDRIKLLQNDKYVVSFTEARVTCAGCQKTIKLDTRNGARGFWVSHRGKSKVSFS